MIKLIWMILFLFVMMMMTIKGTSWVLLPILLLQKGKEIWEGQKEEEEEEEKEDSSNAFGDDDDVNGMNCTVKKKFVSRKTQPIIAILIIRNRERRMEVLLFVIKYSLQ